MWRGRLLLLLLPAVWGSHVQGAPSDCDGNVNFERASTCCQSRGQAIPGVSETSTAAVKAHAQGREIWFDLRRRQLPVWTWVDGTPANSSLTVELDRGNCAHYDTTTHKVKAAHCSYRHRGYICATKGCTDCASLGLNNTSCIKQAGVCYITFCGGKRNWYDARAHCLDQGWDLSDVRTNTATVVSSFNCPTLFVGLRREDWVAARQNSSGTRSGHVTWGPREPSDRGNCTVMDVKDGGPRLKVKPCQTSHRYICVDPVWRPDSPDEKHGLAVAVILLGILSVVVVAGVSVFAYRKYNQKELVRRRRLDEEIDLKELTLPLSPDGYKIGFEPNKKSKAALSQIQTDLAQSILHKYSGDDTYSWLNEEASATIHDMYSDLICLQTRETKTRQEPVALLRYTEIFAQGVSSLWPRLIFIEGEAGTGKTSLAKRIALKWSRLVISKWLKRHWKFSKHVRKVLGQFMLVIPICVREVKEDQNLQDIIQDQLTHDESEAQTLCAQIKQHQERTLVILEGYDEFDNPGRADVTKIATRALLSDVNVLVTSRYNPSHHYGDRNDIPDIHVMLRGVSQEGVANYVSKTILDNREQGPLISVMRSTEEFRNFSRFPVLLAFICIMWKHTKQIYSSFTEFYREFVAYVCTVYEQRNANGGTMRSNEEILRKYKSELVKIGEVAFSGLMKKELQLSFDAESVREKVGEKAWGLGFFRRQEGTKLVAFPHKSLQEFFASYYIVNIDMSKQNEILLDLCMSSTSVKEGSMIMSFISGLGGAPIMKHVIPIMQGSVRNVARTRSSLQLTYLSENKNAKFTLPAIIELEILSRYRASLLTTYLLMDATEVTEITLVMREVRHVAILKHMRAPNLRCLRLRYHDVWYLEQEDELPLDEDITDIFAHLSLEELCVHNYKEVAETGHFAVILDSIATMALQKLDFSGTLLGSENFEKLVDGITLLGRVTELRFRDCTSLDTGPIVYEESVGALLRCLPYTPELEVLDIYDNRGDREIFNKLAGYMLNLPKLRELRLCDCLEQDQGAGGPVVSSLKVTPNIEILELGAWSVDASGLQKLGKALEGLTSLRELYLASCIHANFITVMSWIPTLPKLELLDLSDSTIDLEAVAKLADKLTEFPSLTTLALRYYSLADNDTFLKLVQALPKCSGLSKLDVSFNNFDDDLKKLATMTDKMVTLDELNLSINDISYEVKFEMETEIKAKLPNLNIIF